VGCFNSRLIQDVLRSQLGPVSNSGSLTSAESRLEVSNWCQARGYGARAVHEVPSATTAHVHCFQPAVTQSWKFVP
jgi:hypothetical protein